jgi:hypothetical protein
LQLWAQSKFWRTYIYYRNDSPARIANRRRTTNDSEFKLFINDAVTRLSNLCKNGEEFIGAREMASATCCL